MNPTATSTPNPWIGSTSSPNGIWRMGTSNQGIRGFTETPSRSWSASGEHRRGDPSDPLDGVGGRFQGPRFGPSPGEDEEARELIRRLDALDERAPRVGR